MVFIFVEIDLLPANTTKADYKSPLHSMSIKNFVGELAGFVGFF